MQQLKHELQQLEQQQVVQELLEREQGGRPRPTDIDLHQPQKSVLQEQDVNTIASRPIGYA